MIDGLAPLRTLNRKLGTRFPVDGPKTLNGLILAQVGDIPEVGTRVHVAGETLDDAVQEFNRYNQRQIRIADRSIVDFKVGGNFRTTDVDSFTAALQHNFGFRVQVGDNDGDIRLSAGVEPP